MKKRVLRKTGFTLIEMSIVMGIVAILVLIGVFGLIGGRAASMTNAAAEELVTQIRDSQTKSTIVAKDSSGNADIPKGWGVHLSNTGFDLVSYRSSSDETNLIIQDPPEYTSTTNKTIGAVTYQIDVKKDDGSLVELGGYKDLYITFMAPFGTPYIYYTNGSDDCSEETANCSWQESDRSTEEWGLLFTSTESYLSRSHNTDYTIEVTMKYQNSVSKMVINSSGDVHIEQ